MNELWGAPSQSRLYAIVDVDTCNSRGLNVLDFTRAVCAARPRLMQLRAKSLSARDTLALLRAVVPLAHAAGVPVFANDRPDLAVLADADGVHVGQDDLPIEGVRRFSPHLLVGYSTHNETQLREALQQAPDYVAFGPIYATSTKLDAEPVVGISGLVTAARLARAAKIPLVAIGGITAAHIGEVAAHADWVCMISALIPASARLDEVSTHALALAAEIRGEHPAR